ncbi:hypothetical protein SNE40_015195 [Patella caerulea]|uniref:Uncharacterized protein n=1 Tax=Patella caerulea TaxID=87958 RepID=A0AAN8PUS8_PATCE
MFALVGSLVILASLTTAVPLNTCKDVLKSAGLSGNFNETIAHAIHSMNMDALRMFNPHATEENNIPTVNHDLSHKNKVLPFAPEETLGEDFSTHPMNLIDKILSNLGTPDDGLGPNWSPIERVAHVFHMWDLWMKIRTVYNDVVPRKPNPEVCSCLLDTEKNGIRKAVQWVADHYKTGTPITLLNRPIPKLVDSTSWATWKNRLLHYYTPQALADAARFIQCTALEN